jgi:hypothetical protein
MFSRYKFMSESRTLDTVDNMAYPDPLSINYNDAKLNQIPKLRELSKADTDKFWYFIFKHYKDIAEGDDVILTVNNIPYITMLEPGDSIYLLDKEDIYNIV